MARTILVLGATGHLGRHLVPMLVDRYGTVNCFVRSTSNRAPIDRPGVSFVEGDLRDSESLEAALRGVDTLISAVVLHNFARPLLREWKMAGIRRSVFVTTTSVFTSLEAETKRLKIAAESKVTESGLNYTVLRPTMIYGTPADRNIARLVRLLRWSPVVFIPGDGESLQQPIHVEDVATAIVDCLDSDASAGKAYNISGAHAITFNQMIDETCAALGVRRLKIHLPLRPFLWAVRVFGRLVTSRFLKEEQILRLNEDKSFDHSAARRDFSFSPRTFAAGVRQEVALFGGFRTDS